MKIIEIWIDNIIGNEGAEMLSESLKTNTTLTVLNLSCDENMNYKNDINEDKWNMNS